TVEVNGAILITLSPGRTSYSNTGLTAATTYSYSVSATDPAGNTSPLSDSVTATTWAANQRNVMLQPFESSSIWNTPIGTGAVYVQANITPPASIAQDDDILILTPTAPMTAVDTSKAAWQSATINRCNFKQWPVTPAGFSVPVPTNFILDNTLPGMDGTPNNAGAVLQPDNQTLIQFQPLQRCTAGGPLTYLAGALYANGNLYTDGMLGAHGGSQLSSIGGTIRLAELQPGNSPIVNGVADVIRHVLKFEFNTGLFSHFGAGPFWPAQVQDGASEGLLVALLPSFNYNNLQSAPGRSIAWTLINYGAYIVDNSGWDDINICTELSTSTLDGTINRVYSEFQSDWGYSFARDSQDSTDPATPWSEDIQTIVANLQVITNNGPASVGGGGTPLQPLLPAVTSPGGN
ncbi:MAG TPA: hypothetical protein VG672_03670, partial [Bryobacteraceae bacterium]|nr:hypothetical protein [Bryobacteraceae bacterium]